MKTNGLTMRQKRGYFTGTPCKTRLREVRSNVFLDRKPRARPDPCHHRRAQGTPPPQRRLDVPASRLPAAAATGGFPHVQETGAEGISGARRVYDLRGPSRRRTDAPGSSHLAVFAKSFGGTHSGTNDH